MALVIAGIVGGAGSILGGIFGASAASKRARAAAKEKARLTGELKSLEASRQEIINPWKGAENLSYLAENTLEEVGNSFANLSVATQAAEFQNEQADIALANTLDTLRSTGASAGGATALAQAALESKKGISATIEAQEVANEKAKAEGQMRTDTFNAQAKMTEEQRLQNIEISEAQRLQQADAQGNEWMFNKRETREVAKMDRVAGLIDGAQARESQAHADKTAAITGAIGGLSQVTGAYMGAQGQVMAAGGGGTPKGTYDFAKAGGAGASTFDKFKF